MVELRDLVRGIHPSVLTDRGLDAAASGLADRCPGTGRFVRLAMHSMTVRERFGDATAKRSSTGSLTGTHSPSRPTPGICVGTWICAWRVACPPPPCCCRAARGGCGWPATCRTCSPTTSRSSTSRESAGATPSGCAATSRRTAQLRRGDRAQDHLRCRRRHPRQLGEDDEPLQADDAAAATRVELGVAPHLRRGRRPKIRPFAGRTT